MTTDCNSPVRRRKRKETKSTADTSRFKLFATTDAGLEEVLADELQRLGVTNTRICERGVAFIGDQATVYRTNLNLRTAYTSNSPSSKPRTGRPSTKACERYSGATTLRLLRPWPWIR